MPILAPFEAFARDAAKLNVEADESRLPVKWLAAAQVASRLADSRPHERKALLRIWVQQQAEDGSDGVWSALAVPGLPVRDMGSASAALCHIAADMERGGALNLAYSTVTHMRISMLERGPALARGLATLQQARILRQMGLLDEASDTYQEAREDGIRASNSELEGRASLGEATVAGQRGNYPDVTAHAKRAMELLPADSEYRGDAHTTLMIAATNARDFSTAFEQGWKAFDSSRDDVERRLTVIGNLSKLAMRTGRFAAARRGFLAVLRLTKLERFVFPNVSNLALLSAATGDLDQLRRVTALFERQSTISTQPYELSRASFHLAEAWQQAGDLDEAAKHLGLARTIAAAHGFHEVGFRSELLVEAIAAAEIARPAVDPIVHTALARLEGLEVDESVLLPA